jgi:translation initiation factor 3 subunit D
MRPTDFAAQLNVSLANGWGIVRTVTDLCMKMPEGKYVLVKDPNKVISIKNNHYVVQLTDKLPKPVIRLYSVPLAAFTNDDEEAVGEAFEDDE